MQQYNVTGMSCAACSARVEKAVKGVPGVTACAVSLLTNSMGVEGTADERSIVAAVEAAGYGASLKGAAKSGAGTPGEDALADRETPALKKRLFSSLGFLALLMYLSMGHNMAGFPVPGFLENPVSMALTQMLIAIVVMLLNKKFFTSGFKSLLHGAPNMDTLVALGSAAAFGYSLAELYLMIAAQAAGEGETLHRLAHNLYFETAAMIPCLITVGKLLEAISKGRTTDALKGLMKLAPKTAVLWRDGREEEVDIAEVQVGDVFVLRPGDAIPVDGVVLEGESAVNEAALTGESIPVDKAPGDRLSAATINQSGFLKARATRVGEDTTLSQIIRMVSDAAATKAPIARIADRVSAVFVPAVIGVALLTLAIWLIAGKDFTFSIARAIAVLVISCPCALGLATPVAIMVGNGVGAKNGILFKTAVSQEEAGKMDIVALDKTGTITTGEPRVTDLLPAEGVGEEELLRLAASLEQYSEHPLAKAVLACAGERGTGLRELEGFRALPGNGLTAQLDGKPLLGGSGKFLQSRCPVPQELRRQAEELSEQGKTPLFFALDGRLLGVLAVADTSKEDSASAVKELQNMGLTVVMLTGDNARTARAIGAQAGVDRVIAGVLPEGKESVIRSLQEYGKVAMVGDGINDAPALTRADLGLAIGAGTDVAIDAADVVLMHSRLSDVSAAVRLSRATVRNIHENLFWAFFYNIICIPLAAGFYQALFGWSWEMNPMIGAAAMALSSVTVCSNALRLNLFKLRDPRHDRPRLKHKNVIPDEIFEEKENETMERTLKIEGMMCKHCEARVKKTLESLEGVESAVVSHETGTAVVTGTADYETMKAAVEAQDYKVLGIE
ncbi:MAG: heavy metal translocating P-type ATPase [Oscillospiraceae bacterium]|nr:heavy metal translocating P-type ATPase [Oscillospiraceae bacterium]